MKVRFELVTPENEALYIKINKKSHQNVEDLFHLHQGWFNKSTYDHSWNSEKYIIINVDENKLIGYFGFSKQHQDMRAIIDGGMYILPGSRKKGVFSEIAVFLGNRIFINLGYNKIEASCWATNSNACEIYKSVMHQEGTRKERHYFNRKFVDELQFGVTFNDSVWSDGLEKTIKIFSGRL